MISYMFINPLDSLTIESEWFENESQLNVFINESLFFVKNIIGFHENFEVCDG